MNIDTLVKRARLQRVTNRASDLDALREMLDGTWVPANGLFMPSFLLGTARHEAFRRALRTTGTIVPLIINKTLAALDLENITWSDAESGKDRANDLVKGLDLEQLARDLAIEYKLTGACAAIASTPRLSPDSEEVGEPTITVMGGVNVPYAEAHDPTRVTGWYRAVQFADDTSAGRLRWWVEAFDFASDTHRVWRSLSNPTELGRRPDEEYTSAARPRFALYGVQPDGLPLSPLLANMGRILGLYATELRLATTEELAAFPMLVTRGEVDVAQVGPAEVIAADADGDARWLDPGSLAELREQLKLKRDQAREAFNLPGGSLGNETPSGEALEEANRGFLQETQATAEAVSRVLTDAVSDFLALHDAAPVTVSVPVDRAYTRSTLLATVEKGASLGAVPRSVTARVFQALLGSTAYSDEELTAFLAGDGGE